MASKPRVKVPKSAKKGDMFQIKTLITHKMETGTAKGKDGKLKPRKIINKFVCNYNGKEVFAADMHPAVAANPYLAFYVKATESGTLDLSWTEDGGKVIKDSKKISVS